ncbi:C1 family peptidase [Holophaga foetida]|uniref:C1 family peptidase n=1 Tax=Holophaga foetida TaxID=35839 RepID=UPI000247533D|nr:C1 family peptidase [Holophaga foetida]
MAARRSSSSQYGWIPDLPDQRDFRYALQRMPLEAPEKLPAKVDLSATPMAAPYDQGDLGSCTANAIGAAFQFEHRRQDLGDLMPSRLFIYYAEREIEGSIQSDSGAMIRDGIKVVAAQGAPPEELWPYTVTKFATRPPRKAYKAALEHKAISYFRLNNARQEELLTCLASGFPFIFGFTVYENFETPQVYEKGVLDMPGEEDRVLGGHAVLAVGYEMKTKRFLVRNSYGTEWGRKGHFTIPFDYLTDDDLAADFWTIRDVT